jgi:hypothetical protein
MPRSLALLLALTGLGLPARGQPLISASATEGLSKKELLAAEKASRPPVRRLKVARTPPLVPVSLRNLWTNETLPVDPARPPAGSVVDSFLRCHFTNQPSVMDPRLLDVILKSSKQFKSYTIDVISAFRSPKYNLMLRKKGHEVARESEHPQGHAIDFRIPGQRTKLLVRFVRSLRIGGVGYYPHSAFVHADVGRIRFWRGH